MPAAVPPVQVDPPAALRTLAIVWVCTFLSSYGGADEHSTIHAKDGAARELGPGDAAADHGNARSGDLHEVDFGSGYRLATLGHILHSEGEARGRRLLRKVYDALAPGGTIAIAEFMPSDDRTGGPMPLLFGVNMLVHTTAGDVFTFRQISGWLSETGYVNVRPLEVPAPSPLVLADKR